MMEQFFQWLVCSLIFVRVFCVARCMDEHTPTRAKVQHGLVLVLATVSLPIFVPQDWAAPLLGFALWLHMAVERRQPGDWLTS
jgi:hypothetical protein